MIQDIGKHRFHNEYMPVPPREDSIVLVYRRRELFVRCEGDQMTFLTYGQVIEKFPDLRGQETYLFAIDDQTYYTFLDHLEECDFPGFSWNNVEILRRIGPKDAAFAGITGFQITGWYRSRRFCPCCGQPLVHDEKERMMRCNSCGQMEYPKICPAVIVGVTNGDRILLTKYAGRKYKRYALIAGFAETGETIEETVEREVMEEVGLKVKNIRYYKSQPWSFSDTLLMGFFAEVDGDIHISLDETELSEGRWCTRDEIPENDGISLTREMMEVFKLGKV